MDWYQEMKSFHRLIPRQLPVLCGVIVWANLLRWKLKISRKDLNWVNYVVSDEFFCKSFQNSFMVLEWANCKGVLTELSLQFDMLMYYHEYVMQKITQITDDSGWIGLGAACFWMDIFVSGSSAYYAGYVNCKTYSRFDQLSYLMKEK